MNYQRWGLTDTSDIFGPRFDRIQHFLFDARVHQNEVPRDGQGEAAGKE
jgi:hypothetical protein